MDPGRRERRTLPRPGDADGASSVDGDSKMRSLLAAAPVILLLAVACGAEGTPAGEESSQGGAAVSTGPTGNGTQSPARRLRDHRPREDLNRKDMAAARAAVKVGPYFLPGWHEVEAAPDSGSDCTTFNPDLSRFTVTGKARSAMKTDSAARIDFSVKIYADRAQAAKVFELSTGRRDLRCIRDGVADDLREAGFEVPVVESRLLREPPVGAETVIYAIYYELEYPGVEERQPYPVEVYVFHTGRVVGAAFFSFIADKDSELRHARLLEARLRGV